MLQALPYHEPTLIQLLVLASFLYLCNIARIVTDYFLYAGIVAEITLGIVYGSPLANLLPADWEHTFTALGYLGLILVVFEGGLSTNLPVLVSNLPLSTLCALVGIGLPIGLSFALLNVGFGYRPLEAFAAGAALSSTSLGTTLAALNSATKSNPVKGPSQLSNSTRESVDGSIPMSNDQQEDMNTSTPTLPSEPTLQQSRIGTVLISAAIIDDVIGLVIASLIPALATIDSESSSSGSGHGRDNLAWTIVRPLLSSCLIAAVGAIVARFILRPLFWYRRIGERWCAPARHRKPWGLRWAFREGNGWGTEAHADAVKLLLMVAVVSALAAITTYTNTSVLYGAYVSGLILTYISKPPTTSRDALDPIASEAAQYHAKAVSFEDAFARVIGPLQNFFLLPLFFASIGFAIPFLDLWNPTVFWRGIVYSVLMTVAKLAVGLPILLYPAIGAFCASIPTRLRPLAASVRKFQPRTNAQLGHEKPSDMPDPTSASQSDPPAIWKSTLASLPAAAFIGVAMVSRGEIGLLIAQLARTGSHSGDGDSGSSGLLGDEAFLVAIWAILLCTLVGPVSVGVVVRRWGPRVTAGIWA
ncbi:hypothetical protein C8Q76DRAFT_635401 [Earliella scabrosa]|nr:hypothetical protein C8Q76DRAFT_635401 [Earliella scabrosa]